MEHPFPSRLPFLYVFLLSLPCFPHWFFLALGDFSSFSCVSLWHHNNKQARWQKADCVSTRVCWGQKRVVGRWHKEKEKELVAPRLAVLTASPNTVRNVRGLMGAREAWRGPSATYPLFS